MPNATIRGGVPDISDQGLTPPADGLVILTLGGGTGKMDDTERDCVQVDMHIWRDPFPELWEMYARLHRRLYDITMDNAFPLLTCWRASGPVFGRDPELRWPTLWSAYNVDYRTDGGV